MKYCCRSSEEVWGMRARLADAADLASDAPQAASLLEVSTHKHACCSECTQACTALAKCDLLSKLLML